MVEFFIYTRLVNKSNNICTLWQDVFENRWDVIFGKLSLDFIIIIIPVDFPSFLRMGIYCNIFFVV